MPVSGTRRGRILESALILLAVALVFFVETQTAVAQVLQVNPAAITMRRMHGERFEPEQPFSCTLILDGLDAGNLKALGIRETIPPGWEFLGVARADTPPPAVAPPSGTSGVLEFAWIDPPQTFPYALTYTIRPPADASGQQFFHGAVEYRLLGGPQYTPPVVTSVNGPDQIPTLTLLGDNPVEIPVGTPWSEPGYTATDNQGRDATSRVTVVGQVNTESPGTYTLEYRLELPGQQPVTTSRTVVVTAAQDQPETGTSPSPPRPGSTDALPPPVEGSRTMPRSTSQDENRNSPENTVQSRAEGPENEKSDSERVGLPELPSLEALRPLSGNTDTTVRKATIGLTPEQQAALPSDAFRPFPARPDVDPEAVREDILRAIEAEEQQTVQTSAAENKTVQSSDSASPAVTRDWWTLLFGIGVAVLLGSGGLVAGKAVYGRPAWRGPRRPYSGQPPA